MQIKQNYNGLRNMLAGSFYQCWSEFDERNPDKIVDDIISGLKPQDIEDALADIHSILLYVEDRVNFVEILGEKAGCEYDPQYDGMSNVEWIIELKRKLLLSKR